MKNSIELEAFLNKHMVKKEEIENKASICHTTHPPISIVTSIKNDNKT